MIPLPNKIVADEQHMRKIVEAIFAVFAVLYIYFFCRSISPYWFNPAWTTDDALQQAFPFHAVYHPQIFKNDLITKMMESYLAPLHYWLWWGVTWLTADPIMTGHWLTLLQFSLAVGFLFFAVRHVAGVAPACFAVIWLLHTRHIMQRLTGGLPRGWSACVFAAFLFFALSKRHKGVLALLLCGCILNPPGTLVAAGAYGMYLLWGYIDPTTRPEFRRPLFTLIALSPIYIAIVLSVTRMPPEIGTMASYEQALTMPEFNQGGRFPFVPFRPAWEEIKDFGFQTFLNRWRQPGTLKELMPWFVISILALLAVLSFARKRELIPRQVWCFIVSAAIVYFLSRALAFHLYVPNRHLQIPFAFFIITAFSLGLWRLFDTGKLGPIKAAASLFILTAIVAFTAGPGVVLRERSYGDLNFNTQPGPRGKMWVWFRNKTSEDALVAGHPTHIDPVQLLGMRRAYITTETAHPFFDAYYQQIEKRLEISLKAHYAASLEELAALLAPEGITHFVFQRSRFYPAELAKANYHKPLDKLLNTLSARDPSQFAYRQISTAENPPYVAFRDASSVVVDIKKLQDYLSEQKQS